MCQPSRQALESIIVCRAALQVIPTTMRTLSTLTRHQQKALLGMLPWLPAEHHIPQVNISCRPCKHMHSMFKLSLAVLEPPRSPEEGCRAQHGTWHMAIMAIIAGL